MRPIIATILAATVLAAGPVAAKEKLEPEAKLAKLLEGRVAGEAQNCIPLTTITSSQIIDKTAIVYKSGSTYWVNRPKSGADSLDDDDVLVTKLSTGQLCSIDTVQLHDRASHMWSGFVALGEFVPYRKVKTASAQ